MGKFDAFNLLLVCPVDRTLGCFYGLEGSFDDREHLFESLLEVLQRSDLTFVELVLQLLHFGEDSRGSLLKLRLRFHLSSHFSGNLLLL